MFEEDLTSKFSTFLEPQEGARDPDRRLDSDPAYAFQGVKISCVPELILCSGCEITPGHNLIITAQALILFTLAFLSKIGKPVSVFDKINAVSFKILTFGSENKEKQQ